MEIVRAKKSLGQHFLKDEAIARQIVDSLSADCVNVLEIGPGMGVLTQYLIAKPSLNLWAIELDAESVAYLRHHYPTLHVVEGDFLHFDLSSIFNDSFAVIGNFPYNISSQILFRVFDNRGCIPEVVGMFQKEVAERIASGPGSKTYGILSVLLSAFYDIEYLFTVSEHVFCPPPKVKSAVIRLRRNNVKRLECDENLFVSVVKTGFNQRRKTLSNALKPMRKDLSAIEPRLLQSRAEQLSVADFINLTTSLESAPYVD